MAIDLPPGEITVTAQNVAVGDGRSIVHVAARLKKGESTWEALVAPSTGEASASQVLFAGPTGYSKGEHGERRGESVLLVEREKQDASKFVVVGGLNESVALCGEPRMLVGPRALDPKTMTLRSASVQQLPTERRNAASRVVARARKDTLDKPLARLLVAIGSTDDRNTAGSVSALVDGDLQTKWNEARTGTGAGEVVVLRSSSRIPITRVAIAPMAPKNQEPKNKGGARPPALTATPAPALAGGGAHSVAPKTLYLVADSSSYAIELPEDAVASRAWFDVTLPEPLRTSCLALVLDEAFTRGVARPEVSIAELVAYSELDAPGATLEQAARALASTAGSPAGTSSETAAEVLKRAGPAAAEALAPIFSSLDERGRMLALEVASAAGGCDAGARVFVRALSDPSKDVAARAEKMLLGCGPLAAPRLLEAIERDAPLSKGRAALVLALVAPSRALRPVAFAMGHGETAARALLRSAFARAAKRATGEALAELLSESPVPARPDLLRALTGRLNELRERASLAINEWLEKDASFASRYLALEPLSELARASDAAATTRFMAMLGGDPEWGVRARAASLAGPVPAAQGVLLRALDDPEPRVREASLRAVGEKGTSAAAVRVGSLLARDPWTFVRIAAANALAGMPAAPDIDRSLADALADPASRVRVEALEALARHRAAAFAAPVRERLDDDREALDVRVAAVATLGRMCDGESLDTFTTAARRLAQPFPDRAELELGAASVRALGAVHPKDLERRLAPLMTKDVKPTVRDAAARALAEPGECR